MPVLLHAQAGVRQSRSLSRRRAYSGSGARSRGASACSSSALSSPERASAPCSTAENWLGKREATAFAASPTPPGASPLSSAVAGRGAGLLDTTKQG